MTIRRCAYRVLSAALIGLLAACDAGASAPAATNATEPPAAPAQIVPTPLPASTAPAPTEAPAIARVNGEPIALSSYQNQVAQFEAALIAQGVDPNSADGQAQLAAVREQVLSGMIDQLLLEQEARRKGIGVSDADLEAAMQEIISASGGPDAFAAQLAALGQTEAEFRQGQRAAMLATIIRDQVIAEVSSVAPQTHARHILVDNAELANSLLAQLQAGADFTALAQQYSQDTLTRDGGGDLGWFPRGALISKEVEDAAFALQPGQYSGVVQSAFGFHIVQVIEADAARALTPEQLLNLQQVYFERWMNGLRSSANIER
ncbi:MAG TPA: peptidylprolyl isomerase [Anaerolineae bacterium]|nr:peptidylprolyl isomerase [Anaerolineae bacterium]